MQQDKIDKLNSIIAKYNQYEPSELQKDIITILDYGSKEAFKLGKSHCNLISFWALNVASNKTDMAYSYFFKTLIDKKYCEPNGNLLITKDVLCKEVFDYEMELKYFKNFDDVIDPFRLDENKFYQMRIINSSHFMSCYIQDGKLYLSDTNDRGIGVTAVGKKRIAREYFSWLLEI